MSEVTLTDKNFDEEVTKSAIPVLVDFWAVWCGPCQMQMPVLEEITKEYEGKVKVVKLNVDDNPATASKYQVMSIPTLMIFHKGNVVKQMIGVQSKETLVEEIKKVIQ
ncbi:thioredoxin [Candidatus Microgenomates bacterium]|nr:thioredoxin [Candidatus Microgenomates bacterium]